MLAMFRCLRQLCRLRFNSLFEMRNHRVVLKNVVPVSGFNSLFEMLARLRWRRARRM